MSVARGEMVSTVLLTLAGDLQRRRLSGCGSWAWLGTSKTCERRIWSETCGVRRRGCSIRTMRVSLETSYRLHLDITALSQAVLGVNSKITCETAFQETAVISSTGPDSSEPTRPLKQAFIREDSGVEDSWRYLITSASLATCRVTRPKLPPSRHTSSSSRALAISGPAAGQVSLRRLYAEPIQRGKSRYRFYVRPNHGPTALRRTNLEESFFHSTFLELKPNF
ncbi:hypothetical protein V8E55_010686 [Tylopilus felleus]